jgi:hypothetical protein
MYILERMAKTSTPGESMRYFTFLGCPACGGVTVVETTGPEYKPIIIDVQPAGDPSASIDGLPDDVERPYADAIKVLRAGVPDAAAVQLRKTLEAAAAHYDATERTLVKSIEKLIKDGHVTVAFGDALHHVRQVGNVGAHYTDARVDEDTARRALRFTTALLRNLFEVPAELGKLQQEAPPPDDEGS